MKTMKSLRLLLLMIMIASLSCAVMFTVAAESGETAPMEDLVLDFDATTITGQYSVKGTAVQNFVAGKDTWNLFSQGAENNVLTEGIEPNGWMKFQLAQPVKAAYFDLVKINLCIGNWNDASATVSLYGYSDTAMATSLGEAVAKPQSNTVTVLSVAASALADADGYIKGFAVKRDITGAIFFDNMIFVLAEPEAAPTEDLLLDFDGEAITGKNSTDGTAVFDFSVKNVGDWGLFKDSTGKFMSSENISANGWMKLQLAKPVKAEYFDKVKIKFCVGNWSDGVAAKVAFYHYSDTAMENPLTTVEETTGYKNLEMEISFSASSLADEDGYIRGFAAKRIAGNPGQQFFDNMKFVLPEPDVEPTEDVSYGSLNLAESFIINPEKSNPNGVTTAGVVFDELADSAYKPEGNAAYGLGTKHRIGIPQENEGGKVYNALVLSFRTPIKAEWFETIELTFFSGLKADIEFYDSATTNLVVANAKAKVLAKNVDRYKFNTVKLKVADFANADGVVTDITLKATNFADGEQYQLFFGEVTLVKKTETSYLDEFVLTDATEKSIVLGENAEFITENIPEEVGGTGAYDANSAVKITGNTTLTFKKIINQTETQCGNLFMRLYRASDSGVTKIKFSPVSNERSFEEFDVSNMQGWFDLELSVRKYKNDIADIDHINVTVEGEGEILFGGAYVQDKLRVYAEDITTNDISEILPMTQDGISYTSVDAAAPFVPIFERKDYNGDAVKFRIKISDLSKDFGVMVTLKGLFSTTTDPESGETVETVQPTQGIWFWFSKDGVNSIAYSELLSYPEGVAANEWMEVELGTVPYQVNFAHYGECAYMKINGVEMFRANVDENVQLTGKCFGAYMHAAAVGTTVTFASFSEETYQNTPVVNLEIEDNDGSTKLELGNNDYRLRVGRNMLLNGQVISAVQIVSGDSIEIDENGFITTKKAGDTVVKVITSASNAIPEMEYELTIQVRKVWRVIIDGMSYKVEDGALLQLPELTAPDEGYVLSGLYLDEGCQQKFDYEKTPVTADLTLYSGWTNNTGSCSGAIDTSFYLVSSLFLCVAVCILIKKGRIKNEENN